MPKPPPIDGEERLQESLAPLVRSERRREVLRLAERSPDAAASIEEMAIVKCGTFARDGRLFSDVARVLVWNVERGREIAQWAQMDAVRAADILLLCEVDDGMARSGNIDVAAVFAERLGMQYAYAPNYFELTRGTRAERIATRGGKNARGLQGNAILSRWPLRDVRRVPLPVEFDWFRHSERRIGTRVALRATIDGPSGPTTMAVVHLEAFATPAQRARQMRVLLACLEDAPRAIVGGDFNTLGVRPGWGGGIRLLRDRARDPARLTQSVVEYEPLFEEARRAGFSWEDLNVSAATWRFSRFLPTSLRAKLDWVLGRRVSVELGSAAVLSPPSRRTTLTSRWLSDHDGLALCIRL